MWSEVNLYKHYNIKKKTVKWCITGFTKLPLEKYSESNIWCKSQNLNPTPFPIL